MGDKAGPLQCPGSLTGSQWRAPLEKDRRAQCPASVSPKCNSEGRQENHIHREARRRQWLCVQLCMCCRREHRDYSFSSADRDIPTVHVCSHQTGVMNISHPTEGCPTCPWQCFPWCSMCLWAAAEMSSSTCPGQHRWADGCLWGNQAAQLFLLSRSGFICGGKNKVHFFLFLTAQYTESRDLDIYSIENSVWRDIKRSVLCNCIYWIIVYIECYC